MTATQIAVAHARYLGLTTPDICRICGVSRGTVYRWRDGETDPPLGLIAPLLIELDLLDLPDGERQDEGQDHHSTVTPG